MALTPRATHTLQWPAECDAWRQRLANREGRSQCRLGAATRPHEGGVASNRVSAERGEYVPGPCTHRPSRHGSREHLDRKSTRLNSSHANISYAVFCLKKKNHII